MTGLAPISRRSALGLVGAASVFGLAGPARALDQAKDAKLMVVFLHGALDGLAAAPPYGDRRYEALRPNLRAPAPGETGGALALSDGFALHPELTNLHAMMNQGEAALIHAAASPYRERSHFEGQDVLHLGGAGGGLDDGWLNRALQSLDLAPRAMGVGGAQLLALRGKAEAGTWAPSVLPKADADTADRLLQLYADTDPGLYQAFQSALETDAMLDGSMGGARLRGGPRQFEPVLRPAARLMRGEEGAGLVVAALNGWDTHANQNATLGNLLGSLDRALVAVKEEMGPDWSRTVIVIATEFGRTARENGTRGTDHGMGGACFLAGGAVKGGLALKGEWPGLEDRALYEGRDLAPANDLRSVFKGVLRDHWGVAASDLDRFVFPGSASAPALNGLIAGA